MTIAMDKLCRVFSRALDIIEKEQIGASDFHSMRVAALCAEMGRRLGYEDDEISAIATCALFHDNALTEYHLSQTEMSGNGRNMVLHCEKGQSNVSWLPFEKDISGFILYHHERGDGKGPFGKKAGEYPFEAALIAAADSVDAAFRLQGVSAGKWADLRNKIASRADTYSVREATETLIEVIDGDILESLRDENIAKTLEDGLPSWEVGVSDKSVMSIARFAAHVIDQKSQFTRKHTLQIANRAWIMGEYYGYDREQLAALYLAASLHDIGKIATPTAVLEKPGKLDPDEFQIIKDHVRHTHEWLDIPGFELIRDWAANHHEKLDGSGYSFGKPGDELDFNSRLLACIDIYQAVSEPRPYHGARSHEDTMPILRDMAAKGFVDEKIVKDVDAVMARYSLTDAPAPIL